MKIAYLGPKGTFTSTAANKLIKLDKYKDAVFLPCSDIEDVLYGTEEGRYDYGVVPVENSIEGSVNTSIDILINEVRLNVIYEIVLNINHNLAASSQLIKGEKIYSHPQALAQCRIFLKKNYPEAEKISTKSTLQSLDYIKEFPENSLAIVPSFSFEENDIRIIKKNIGDYEMNQTRFYLVSKRSEKADRTVKSSISFQLKDDRPGGLLEIMELFRDKGINLTKIESRPGKHHLGRYIFIIDCEGDLSLEENQTIIENIKEKSSKVKLLGAFGKIEAF
jgi:prephenate dehydratase